MAGYIGQFHGGILCYVWRKALSAVTGDCPLCLLQFSFYVTVIFITEAFKTYP